jgi:hypothetical protein
MLAATNTVPRWGAAAAAATCAVAGRSIRDAATSPAFAVRGVMTAAASETPSMRRTSVRLRAEVMPRPSERGAPRSRPSAANWTKLRPGREAAAPHGTTAVASISTRARASTSATTCTTAIAG